MSYLILYISKELNQQLKTSCGYVFNFYAGLTKQPSTMLTRLNIGWNERRDHNPRCGSQSEPLAQCTDWQKLGQWIIEDAFVRLRDDPWFKGNFDQAPHLKVISRRIFDLDVQKFPHLHGVELPLNGLEQVFSVKHQDAERVLGRVLNAEADELTQDEWDKLADFVRHKIETYLTQREISFRAV